MRSWMRDFVFMPSPPGLNTNPGGGGEGGEGEGRGAGVLGLMFAGYVPLASQSPHPILDCFSANYRPHLSHILENVIFAVPT